ncbi:MAG: RagB/SusD family nutrient uptake outer membrane protein, partial [Gemmatimonadota bacterium]
MMTIRKSAIAGILALASVIGVTGCTDVLVEPKSTVTGANIFNDPDAYRAFLAKLYAGLAVTGQQGPAGNSDIEGIDEGFGQYIRGFWQLQELPTEQAVIGWGDAGLPEVVTAQWASSNQFLTAMYYRIYYQIALANEFLRETADDKLTERGVDDALRAEIQQFRAEARWLRALSYWHAMDFFGDVPLVDEDFVIGATPPEQATRTDVFQFIVDELTEIRDELPAVGAGQYGRVDQGGAAMLLAKLYLNAEAYGADDHYADALAEAQTVIDGPYQLDDNYQDLFLADNHTSPELVFAVPFDGTNTQTWGGTTFLVAAALVGDMNQADYGTVEK